MPSDIASRATSKLTRSTLVGKRHAMVVHAYYPVGETRVQREAAALVQQGMSVDVICLRDAGEPFSQTVDGVDIHRLPMGRNRRRGVALQLIEYLAFLMAAGFWLSVRHLRRRYHSVQVHNLPDFLVFAAVVPKLTGARVLLDLHDLMPEFLAARLNVSMRHPLVRLVMLQERLSCGFADQVITVTDGWRQRLIERGVRADKISVVMNVADPHLFRSRSVEPGDGTFTVLYHGTFAHRYGVDLLVEAAELLRSRVPTLRVWLLGDGEYRHDLEDSIARLGLGEVVTLSDGMLDVPRLRIHLEQADVGVVPNRSSVFTDDLLPTKLLEYVAMGIPVVAARTPMIESYFDDQMVEYFTPGDAAELADRLEGLAAAPNRRASLVAAATRFVEDHSWDDISIRYAGVVAGPAAEAVRRAG